MIEWDPLDRHITIGIWNNTILFSPISSTNGTRRPFFRIATTKGRNINYSSRNRIRTALKSKLPPAAQYFICLGDKGKVYLENAKEWNGPYEVTKVSNRIISVTDGIKLKQFNITSVLRIPAKINNPDTKHDMNKIETQVTNWAPESQFPSEILINSDSRYKLEKSNNAIKEKLQGLLQRGVFALVNKNKTETDANIFGRRFILAIKELGSKHESYKERFSVQGHKNRNKDFIIQTGRTVRHRNIRIMSFIAAKFTEPKFGFKMSHKHTYRNMIYNETYM